jgi:hypothetical protein
MMRAKLLSIGLLLAVTPAYAVTCADLLLNVRMTGEPAAQAAKALLDFIERNGKEEIVRNRYLLAAKDRLVANADVASARSDAAMEGWIAAGCATPAQIASWKQYQEKMDVLQRQRDAIGHPPPPE